MFDVAVDVSSASELHWYTSNVVERLSSAKHISRARKTIEELNQSRNVHHELEA